MCKVLELTFDLRQGPQIAGPPFVLCWRAVSARVLSPGSKVMGSAIAFILF